MHVGLIIDTERAVHERPMLDAIIQGLLDEGDAVTLVVPEDIAPEIRPAVDLIDDDAILTFTTDRAPWVRRPALARLGEKLNRNTPDLIYATGKDTWSIGSDLQRRLDRPLALAAWSHEAVRAIPRSLIHAVAAFVVPNPSLEQALHERQVPPDLISLIPYGVDLPPRTSTTRSEARPTFAIAIIGPATDVLAYRAVLQAIALVVQDTPHLHIAMELRGNRSHDIWRAASHLGLLDRLSTIGDAVEVRELITGCDAIVLPEADGTANTLLLEAMAAERAIVALDDPYRTILEDQVNAIVIPQRDRETWASALRLVLTDPDLARRLGNAARRTVEKHHARVNQIKQIRATFERIVSGGAIAFDSAR